MCTARHAVFDDPQSELDRIFPQLRQEMDGDVLMRRLSADMVPWNLFTVGKVLMAWLVGFTAIGWYVIPGALAITGQDRRVQPRTQRAILLCCPTGKHGTSTGELPDLVARIAMVSWSASLPAIPSEAHEATAVWALLFWRTPVIVLLQVLHDDASSGTDAPVSGRVAVRDDPAYPLGHPPPPPAPQARHVPYVLQTPVSPPPLQLGVMPLSLRLSTLHT